ncbi:MAG TPA: LssY C-terminal domain-containing protein [Candidatus Acidoferrales bacterium]|nr:LssY C-terminal domain-containing protein [Candidatus Acidoferrales bacterium]
MRRFPILARRTGRAAWIGFVALAAAALAAQQPQSRSQQQAPGQTQQPATPAPAAQPPSANPKSTLDDILDQLKQPQPSQPGATAEPQQAKPKLSMDEILSRVPQRVTSKDGKPGDMVNFILVGSREQVQGAMKAAGWVTVDRSVQDAITHALDDVLQHQAYNAMPMSQLFLFGRPQDFGYASGIPLEVMQNRDHCRLWEAPWLTPEGRSVWVGAGTHDTNFERDPTGKVTHSIDPNVDHERDNIVQSLQGAAQVKNLCYFTPGKPLREGLTATGDKFTSDGRLALIFLKQ